ncbi:hypothetical protein EVAR_26023_1 [Eumeta japonica]|uniref:Uncharacterized protein n=1 Tax=Eumeta variegata TaxID=151549 RepID=A0A4C1VQK6_EUMVA|nr:hypothetical protein EVAR_26023_1 [Eumeta japonica]
MQWRCDCCICLECLGKIDGDSDVRERCGLKEDLVTRVETEGRMLHQQNRVRVSNNCGVRTRLLRPLRARTEPPAHRTDNMDNMDGGGPRLRADLPTRTPHPPPATPPHAHISGPPKYFNNFNDLTRIFGSTGLFEINRTARSQIKSNTKQTTAYPWPAAEEVGSGTSGSYARNAPSHSAADSTHDGLRVDKLSVLLY